MATVVRESDLQSSDNSSLAPYYDYSSVNEENQTSPTESREIIYATVANRENQNHSNVQNSGVGQYDYTIIYDDPTSTSYVVGIYIYRLLLLSGYYEACFPLQSEVYSSGSVFDSIGTYVPTLVSCMT